MRPANKSKNQVDGRQPLITEYLQKKVERANFYDGREPENMGPAPRFYPDAKGVEKLREEIDEHYDEIVVKEAQIAELKKEKDMLRKKIVIKDKKINAWGIKKNREELAKEVTELEEEIEKMDRDFDEGEIDDMEEFQREYAMKKNRMETLKIFVEENEKEFRQELDEIDDLEKSLELEEEDDNSSEIERLVNSMNNPELKKWLK